MAYGNADFSDPKGVKNAAKGANESLRDWSCPSYDPFTGKPSSNYNYGGSVVIDKMKISPSTQMGRGGAQGTPGRGSPGWDAINEARSTPRGGRAGINKWGASKW